MESEVVEVGRGEGVGVAERQAIRQRSTNGGRPE